jgi:hypothetical protein
MFPAFALVYASTTERPLSLFAFVGLKIRLAEQV